MRSINMILSCIVRGLLVWAIHLSMFDGPDIQTVRREHENHNRRHIRATPHKPTKGSSRVMSPPKGRRDILQGCLWYQKYYLSVDLFLDPVACITMRPTPTDRIEARKGSEIPAILLSARAQQSEVSTLVRSQ